MHWQFCDITHSVDWAVLKKIQLLKSECFWITSSLSRFGTVPLAVEKCIPVSFVLHWPESQKMKRFFNIVVDGHAVFISFLFQICLLQYQYLKRKENKQIGQNEGSRSKKAKLILPLSEWRVVHIRSCELKLSLFMTWVCSNQIYQSKVIYCYFLMYVWKLKFHFYHQDSF